MGRALAGMGRALGSGQGVFWSNVSSLPRSGQCFDKNMPHYGALVTFHAWNGQFLPGMGRALGSGQGVGRQAGPESRKSKK